MNLLIIIEGNDPDKPMPSILDETDKVWLLYLSPRIKAHHYKEELRSVIKGEVEIQIINPKKIVDFDYSRKVLLDFIAFLPKRLKIGDSTLSEYLTIQGLNMWWTSGIVEATPYKRDIFQNFYYLSAVKYTLEKFNIDAVWFQLEDSSLEKDLSSMLDKAAIRYYQNQSRVQHKIYLKSYVINVLKWLIRFFAEMGYSILFKLICPRWVKPQKPEASQKDIHLFYSVYPYNWSFKDGAPEHKIYRGLPSFLSKHLGGEAYFLSALPLGAMSDPFKPIRDAKRFWRSNIRFIPIEISLSLWDIMKAFLSPIRRWKYFRLKRVRKYHELFEIESIDMFHTFDQTMRDSLLGNEAITNLLHCHAFRRFVQRYAKGIFQVIYYLEFHNWEVALISGARNGDSSVPVVGLQQSAPNPTLLSFFFSPTTFKTEEENSYPLPDLILCSSELYKELMHSNGIEPERVEVVGFLGGQYLKQDLISREIRQQKRKEIGLPPHRKICLIACSIDFRQTEGVIFFLDQILSRLPEVLFLIKSHPDTPVESLMCKYGIDDIQNVRSVNDPVSVLLPLSDYFLSTSTSVSQEALWQGIPQINLDVGGLPRANPLHLVPDLIADVESPGELLGFLFDAEKFRIPKEKCYLFMGDPKVDPRRKFLDIVVARFHC